MTGNTKRQSGFTLIEVLISTAIISIAIVVVVQLFFIFYSSAERSYSILLMEADARRIIAHITNRARESRVDYDFYASVPSAEPHFLALRDGDGRQTVYWIFGAGSDFDLFFCDGKALTESCSKPASPLGDPDWAQMNADDITLLSGRFAATPDQDPLFPSTSLEPSSNQAPFVRVIFQLSTGPTDNTVESPFIATTIAPRLYVR